MKPDKETKEFYFDQSNSFKINGENVEYLSKMKRNIGEKLEVFSEGYMGLDHHIGTLKEVKKEGSDYKIVLKY